MTQEKIKILELTSDPVFKAFMMSKNTNALKARLIHLITGIDEEKLLHATYQSIELPIKNKTDKTYKTDVIVKIEKHILSIEMNAENYPKYKVKNFGYTSVVASQIFETGEKYDDRYIIQLNFDDFDSYGLEELIYEFRLMEIKHHLIDDINYVNYHINLSKLKDLCYTNNEEKELINILKVFKITDEEELECLRGEDYMDEAINEMKRICKDERIIGLYDAEAVEKKVMNTRLYYAKQEGIEEGSKREKIDIARNLLKSKINIRIIMEATGLTKEKIEELS